MGLIIRKFQPGGENTYACSGNTEEIKARLKYFESVSCGICIRDGSIIGYSNYISFADEIEVRQSVIIEQLSNFFWIHKRVQAKIHVPGRGRHPLFITLENPSSGIYRATVTVFAVTADSAGRLLEAVKVDSVQTVTI